MEILFYDKDLAVCVKPVGLDSEAQVPAAVSYTHLDVYKRQII